MKRQFFNLLNFKLTDEILSVKYLYTEGQERAGLVELDRELHQIPNDIISKFLDFKVFVLNCSGHIKFNELQRLGFDCIDFDADFFDKRTAMYGAKENFDLFRTVTLTELKLDKNQHGLQICYDSKVLPYAGTTKNRTPKICIDAEIEKHAQQLRDKFKYAVYPFRPALVNCFDNLENECFELALKDVAVKSMTQPVQLELETENDFADDVENILATKND